MTKTTDKDQTPPKSLDLVPRTIPKNDPFYMLQNDVHEGMEQLGKHRPSTLVEKGEGEMIVEGDYRGGALFKTQEGNVEFIDFGSEKSAIIINGIGPYEEKVLKYIWNEILHVSSFTELQAQVNKAHQTYPSFVTLNLKELMEMAGIDGSTKYKRDDFRKKVNEALYNLHNIGFRLYKEGRNNKTTHFFFTQIDAWENGEARLGLNPTYIEAMMSSELNPRYIVLMNAEVFKIPPKRKTAVAVYLKLNERTSQSKSNAKSQKDQESPEDNNKVHALRVANLIKKIPNFATYENVKATKGMVGRRIITPLLNDLEYLLEKNLVTELYFTNASGEVISLEDMQNIPKYDYKTFIDYMIRYKL